MSEKCQIPGCEKNAVRNARTKNQRARGEKGTIKSNAWVIEKYGVTPGRCCASHHGDYYAKLNGVEKIADLTAKKQGFKSRVELAEFQLEERAKKAGYKNGKDYTYAMREELAISKGYASGQEYDYALKLKQAQKAGFETIREHTNSKDPVLKHRKDYCENADGHLGFNCPSNPEYLDACMLDVHHKILQSQGGTDDPDNLLTLCKCCHAKHHTKKGQTLAVAVQKVA